MPTLVYACASVSLWVCDFILCVCVCVRTRVCDLSDTHPLYERHITLQMTLLDGDGPFNYSTLMQSAVNTLNQAAEEEAAYPSSLLPSLTLFPSLALTLSLSLSSSVLVSLSFASYLFHCICPILVFLLSIFWFPFPLLVPLFESACRHSPVSNLHRLELHQSGLRPLLSITACCPPLPPTPPLIAPHPGWP